VPANTGQGDVFVEVGGPGSFNSQVQLPVAPAGVQMGSLRSAERVRNPSRSSGKRPRGNGANSERRDLGSR
jgi:hypothetical protein